MRAAPAACQPDYLAARALAGFPTATSVQCVHTRGASQSGLIVHLVALGLATESGEGDPLLRYLGSFT